MPDFTGYRTLVIMVLGLIAAVLQHYGWILPESDQGALATAIISIAGIVMRLLTKTPAGTKIVPPLVMIWAALLIGSLSACASHNNDAPPLSPREISQQVDASWQATQIAIINAMTSTTLNLSADVKKKIAASSDLAFAAVLSFHDQANKCVRDPTTSAVGDAPGLPAGSCNMSAIVIASNTAMSLIGQSTGLLNAFGVKVGG